MSTVVQRFLTERGWSEPIVADSGNGAHLLYPIDLPNDDESTMLIKRALEALDFQFSNETVNVDKGVFNAARIWKLYGTMACKGDHTDERPHRLSQILSCPEELKEVSAEQLKSLAAICPTMQIKGKSASKKSNTEEGFNLEEFIEQHELDVAFTAPWQREQPSMYYQLVLGMKVTRIKVPISSTLLMVELRQAAIIIAVQKKIGKHCGRNLNQIGLQHLFKKIQKRNHKQTF